MTSPDGRAEIGFSKKADTATAEATVFPCRVKPGDDATCLNLYLPRQPRILGLPNGFIDVAASPGPTSPDDAKANPWTVLE